jgi:hypothetical protein
MTSHRNSLTTHNPATARVNKRLLERLMALGREMEELHTDACGLHQNDYVCQKKERNDFVGCISNSGRMQEKKKKNDVKKMMGNSRAVKKKIYMCLI